MRAFPFLLCSLASAWIDNGHMLVSEIAKMDMSERDSDAITQILQSFELDPSNRVRYDAVTAAVWPDHIKCKDDCQLRIPVDLRAFNSWHYTDLPYNPDHLENPNVVVAEQTGNGTNSAIWILRTSFFAMEDSKDILTWNFLLRYVLHVVGDLHQPLHAVTGFFNDSTFGYFPAGDLGGNLIKLEGPISELHLFWDMAGGKYMHDMPVPLPSDLENELVVNATLLMQRFPRSVFGGLLKEDKYWDDAFQKWADESHAYAKNTTYVGIAANSTPSAEYIKKTQDVCDRRIALAGYRLADMLRKILEYRPRAADVHLQKEIADAEAAAAEAVRARAKASGERVTAVGGAAASGGASEDSGVTVVDADGNVNARLAGAAKSAVASARRGFDVRAARKAAGGVGSDVKMAAEELVAVKPASSAPTAGGVGGILDSSAARVWAAAGGGVLAGLALATVVAAVVVLARSRRSADTYVEVERDPLLTTIVM